MAPSHHRTDEEPSGSLYQPGGGMAWETGGVAGCWLAAWDISTSEPEGEKPTLLTVFTVLLPQLGQYRQRRYSSVLTWYLTEALLAAPAADPWWPTKSVEAARSCRLRRLRLPLCE